MIVPIHSRNDAFDENGEGIGFFAINHLGFPVYFKLCSVDSPPEGSGARLPFGLPRSEEEEYVMNEGDAPPLTFLGIRFLIHLYRKWSLESLLLVKPASFFKIPQLIGKPLAMLAMFIMFVQMFQIVHKRICKSRFHVNPMKMCSIV